MDVTTQHIPEVLIYEMVNEQPIYYRGYRNYLNGQKKLEELRGSSKLQSALIAELVFLLRSQLTDGYLLFSNEVGLQFSPKSWRAADIAVIKRDKVTALDNKYLSEAPELVIEVDTKADLTEIKNPLGYYQEKTDELLQFGVERVIWIFSDTQKVLLAEKSQKKWELMAWDEAITLMPGIEVNVAQLLADLK